MGLTGGTPKIDTPTSSPTKSEVIADEHEVLVPKPPTSSTEDGDQKIMEGATLSLLCGALFPCIPVTAVCAVLLTLIFKNQIKEPYMVVQEVSQAHTTDLINQTLTEVSKLKAGGDNVYWLWAKKSTTPGTLHMIASITGKVMPFITSTCMALVAFFAGRRIISITKVQKQRDMPTPHQMSILISLLNGSGVKPLWETLKYRYRNHEALVQPVPLAFWSLAWIVVLTLAIQSVDSWFGVATQPATVQILMVANTTSAYGRQLNSSVCSSLWHQMPCIGDSSALCDYPCSITNWTSPTGSERFGLQHAQEAAEVLMNNSYINFVLNVSAGSYDTQHYFLGDKKSSTSHDFTTDTFAVSTSCEVITQNCSIGTGFTCGGFTSESFAWTGAVGVERASATGPSNQSSTGIQFFNDSGLTVPVGGDASKGLFITANPAPFLLFSKGFPPIDTSADQFTYMRDNHYLGYDSSGDPVFVLNCSMSVYQAKYNYTNGGVSKGGLFDLRLADPAYGGIFSAGFAVDSALGHLSLQDAAALAAYQHRPDLLANSFANQFSQSAVSLSAGIMSPSENVFEQRRWNNVLVTKVPILPLYVLIALKAIYALFALGLAGLAILLADPITTQDVKERLTIDGLAVGLFESDAHRSKGVTEIEQLYREHNAKTQGDDKNSDGTASVPAKVGMVRNAQGGWSWATTVKLADSFGLSQVSGLVQNDVKAGLSTIIESGPGALHL
ncbi:hypothetical protein LTR84_009592 [Exophiala bonariae]|uniref:Peptidase A1 domain-containing protein n=1 Tax=Exophiala bonariae TaxID=1690606 RepID=A0AAV9NJQ3_9EURO|nr:hypothetical protein LTR84_009592 [Exophiala bonariae]